MENVEIEKLKRENELLKKEIKELKEEFYKCMRRITYTTLHPQSPVPSDSVFDIREALDISPYKKQERTY